MPFQIDGSLYPDIEVPDQLDTLADRVDFLVRLCGAWDFGMLPDRDTVETLKTPEWREANDAERSYEKREHRYRHSPSETSTAGLVGSFFLMAAARAAASIF